MKWLRENFNSLLKLVWALWFGGVAVYFLFLAFQTDDLGHAVLAGLSGLFASLAYWND